MGGMISGIVGGILGKKSAKKQAKRQEAAGLAAQNNILQGGQQARDILNPYAETGSQANNVMAGGLGLGGQEGSDAAFGNFLNSSGFKAQLAAGSEAITGNQAAAGLLNSGSTLKRLNTFGQDLAQQGFSNFLGNLGNVAGRGLTAAGGQASAVQNSANAGAQAMLGGTNAGAETRAGGQAALQSGLGQASKGLFSMIPGLS
tara:strand:- start:9361 stop:9966 length:606 start_codon:yes stop_codon:yes gene_type:complete